MKGNESIYNNLWNTLFEGYPTITFKNKSAIIELGELNNRVYFIKKGKVKFSVITSVGNEKTIYILNKGGIFGDIAAVAARPFYLSATTQTSCTLSYMNPQVFLQKVLSDSEIAKEWIKTQSEIIEYLIEHITDLTFLHKESLICKYIYRLSLNYGVETAYGIKIQSKITHRLLAELIGCSRTTVSKTISKLLKGNIISKRNSFFYITDIERLKAIMYVDG